MPVRTVLGACLFAASAWVPASAAPLRQPSDVVPVPPRRPAELNEPPGSSDRTVPAAKVPTASAPTTPVTPVTPSPVVPTPSPGESEACDAALAAGTLKATRLASFGVANGCGVAVPVKLTAVILAGKGEVVLEPPVTLRCAMASAVADWIRTDLAPLLAARGGGLTRLSGIGGYECRGRNRVAGAKLSEHAAGNAMDISAFVLKDGSSAKITDVPHNEALFAQVKLTACARFSTVLGPGSDGYHEDNLHLDIEARRGGRHLCQWQLP